MDLKWAHWSLKLVNDAPPEVSVGPATDPSPVRFSAEDSPIRFRDGGDVGGERHWNELRCDSALVPVVESTDFGELDDAAHLRRINRSGLGAILVQRQVGP